MQKPTYWTPHADPPTYSMLRGRQSADVCVIGGGLSGLATTLWLSKAGLRVILLEARALGSGSSSYCAGIVSLANYMMYDRLEQKRGIAVTNAYAQTQLSALQALRELASEQGCDWRDEDARLTSNEAGDALTREAEAMRRAGLSVSVEPATQSPLPAKEALLMRDMATLHPLKLMRLLARRARDYGAKIYERSRVTALETNLAYTERGSVLAPYLVVATGYPIVNTPGWYFLTLTQKRSDLMPMSGGAGFEGVYLDAQGGYAVRQVRGETLFMLNGGIVGTRGNQPFDTFQARYAPFTDMRPKEDVFSGSEVFTPDGLPCIGAYSPKTPNLFLACGYGGRGLIGSVMAAQAISARVLGLPSDGYEIYEGRHGGMREMVTMGGRYIRSQYHISAPRCPHMGCKLVYLKRERIWECPCHGSRFDDIGHVLSAPSIHEARVHHPRGG